MGRKVTIDVDDLLAVLTDSVHDIDDVIYCGIEDAVESDGELCEEVVDNLIYSFQDIVTSSLESYADMVVDDKRIIGLKHG